MSSKTDDKMTTSTANTEISLKNFFIYNTSYGQKEGQEEEKLMYFHPRSTNLDIQMKEVGLSEAIVKFTDTFSNDLCDTLQTKKSKKFFYRPEENFWMIMTVNVPTCLVSRERLDGVHYLPGLVQNPVYLAVLRQAYLTARLFLGPFQQLIDKEQGQPVLLKRKLDLFFTKYLLSLDLRRCDILDLFQGVQFLPLDKTTFLHAQCAVNLVQAAFPIVSFALLLFNEQIVWSGLPAEDAQVVFRYLVSSLIPSSLQTHSLSSETTKIPLKPNRFLAGPESLANVDICSGGKVPRVHLCGVPAPGFYHLVLYRYFQTTLALLIPGVELLRLDWFRRLDCFLTSRLGRLNKELSEYTEQESAQDTAGPTDTRYVYFNSLNLATKSTLHDKKGPNEATLSRELLNALVDIHQIHNRVMSDGGVSSETVLKTMSDHWVVGRLSNCRQFFITLERNKTNLVELNDEVKKICEKQLKNIFFHV